MDWIPKHERHRYHRIEVPPELREAVARDALVCAVWKTCELGGLTQERAVLEVALTLLADRQKRIQDYMERVFRETTIGVVTDEPKSVKLGAPDCVVPLDPAKLTFAGDATGEVRVMTESAFDTMQRLCRELDRLIADGRGDTPEADAIRDASDGPWHAMTEAERQRIRERDCDAPTVVVTDAGKAVRE